MLLFQSQKPCPIQATPAFTLIRGQGDSPVSAFVRFGSGSSATHLSVISGTAWYDRVWSVDHANTPPDHTLLFGPDGQGVHRDTGGTNVVEKCIKVGRKLIRESSRWHA